MKYAVRTTRDTFTGEVSVHRILRVRDAANPYRLRYPETGTAESLQIFSTRAEAEKAHAYEKFAAEYAEKQQDELLWILRDALDEFKSMGLSQPCVCKITGAPYDAIRAYLSNFYKANPRVVAKVVLALWEIREASDRAKNILPDTTAATRE